MIDIRLRSIQVINRLRWHNSLAQREFRLAVVSEWNGRIIRPWQLRGNAHCERLIGSLKRECLDHMLVFHRQQLHRIVTEFINYYNHSRPHQGINQRIPARFDQGHPPYQAKLH